MTFHDQDSSIIDNIVHNFFETSWCEHLKYTFYLIYLKVAACHLHITAISRALIHHFRTCRLGTVKHSNRWRQYISYAGHIKMSSSPERILCTSWTVMGVIISPNESHPEWYMCSRLQHCIAGCKLFSVTKRANWNPLPRPQNTEQRNYKWHRSLH